MSNKLLEDYTKACTYPGRLDERAVNESLRKYCEALGVQRTVARIPRGWTPDSVDGLRMWGEKLAMEICKNSAASDASDARAASAARDASDARDASAARDAWAASDARAAWDASADSDASDASAARDARDASEKKALKRLLRWALFRMAWYWDSEMSWLGVIHCGAVQEQKVTVMKWSQHCYDAFLNGCFFVVWTDTHLYWCAKPEIYKNEQRQPHREDGPALRNDIEDLFFVRGTMVTEQIVMHPKTITGNQVGLETNAEVRRIMIERMGAPKYLHETQAKLLDADYEGAKQGAAPRALLQDMFNDKWMVAADGSTEARTYYLPVPENVQTCVEAHVSICGFDEKRILVKS